MILKIKFSFVVKCTEKMLIYMSNAVLKSKKKKMLFFL